MPSNGTPADEYHIKPHEPRSQEPSIHLFRREISELYVIVVSRNMKEVDMDFFLKQSYARGQRLGLKSMLKLGDIPITTIDLQMQD